MGFAGDDPQDDRSWNRLSAAPCFVREVIERTACGYISCGTLSVRLSIGSVLASAWNLEAQPQDIFRLNCSHRRGGDFERVYPLIRPLAVAWV